MWKGKALFHAVIQGPSLLHCVVPAFSMGSCLPADYLQLTRGGGESAEGIKEVVKAIPGRGACHSLGQA